MISPINAPTFLPLTPQLSEADLSISPTIGRQLQKKKSIKKPLTRTVVFLFPS